MAQQNISDSESGLNVRNALNSMFAELYANIVQPIRILGASGNTIQPILANTMVVQLQIRALTGSSPTIRIGLTPNGQEILDDTVVNTVGQFVSIDQYFSGAGNIYFTWTTGSGSVNVRIDVINNYN